MATPTNKSIQDSEYVLLPFKPLPPGVHPPYRHEPYVATLKRSPSLPLISIPQSVGEIAGPVIGALGKSHQCDMSRQAKQSALGERIAVSGRLLDEAGRPQPNQLIEVWQANSAGRYRHKRDQHDAPLDPNFAGSGRVMTDGEGRYRFITIRPGAYPWRNHHNAWRPAHIHFSLFGPSFSTRLVTQMYFPGDPLLSLDPIYNSTADEQARTRLISEFDLESTVPEEYLSFRFDIIIRGRHATPWQNK